MNQAFNLNLHLIQNVDQAIMLDPSESSAAVKSNSKTPEVGWFANKTVSTSIRKMKIKDA